MKELCKPDKRNEFFNITVQSLRTDLGKVSVSGKIPGKIHAMLGFAKKICLYGYYEYDFYTLCMTYLSLLTETAIKERFLQELPQKCEFRKKKETKLVQRNYHNVFKYLLKNWRIVGYEMVGKPLNSIIKYLREHYIILKRISDEKISWYIELRNMSAHLQEHYISMPTIVIPIFWHIIDFVNCLFDTDFHKKEPRVIRLHREYHHEVHQAYIQFIKNQEKLK